MIKHALAKNFVQRVSTGMRVKVAKLLAESHCFFLKGQAEYVLLKGYNTRQEEGEAET